MIGAGKYDLECSLARARTGAAGAVLIILAGTKGDGFSAQVPGVALTLLPQVLRDVANQIEADAKKAAERDAGGHRMS